MQDKIECHTITPGGKSTKILQWKYDIIAKAILELLPTEGPGIAFKDLLELVIKKLDAATQEKIGSIPWYTTTVKLDLEYKRKIFRVSGSNPQRLKKNKS